MHMVVRIDTSLALVCGGPKEGVCHSESKKLGYIIRSFAYLLESKIQIRTRKRLL